jgi:molecular chaperone HtpG
MIARINKSLTHRILSELSKMMDKDREKYETFYREFSRMLKEGVHMDYANRSKLQDLLLFESMNNPAGKLISLKEYSDAMPATQKAIYYICGESRDALEQSPQLEMLRKQGYDVLFLLEPIDEFVLGDLGKYAEKELASVSKGDVKFDEVVQKELDEKTKKAGEESEDLVEYLKKTLEDRVKDVRFTGRLTESPCCLVSDANDPTLNMQRIMRAMDKNAPTVKRILELNMDNALIRAMKRLHERNAEDPALKEYAEMLYDQAVVAEGGELRDPVKFAKRTASLMAAAIEKELSAD